MTQGFYHSAILDITEANITRAEDLIISTDASATKSPAELSSYRADTIFSWSEASSNSFSMLEVQLVIALPTAAKVTAGLQAPSAAEYALLWSRSKTSLKVTASSIGRVTYRAKHINEESTTRAEMRGFTAGSLSG